MSCSLWVENFDTMDPDHSGGKSLFCYRLGKYFQSQGTFQVTGDINKRVDFSLNVVQIHNTNARKKILRLDGVWHDTGKDYQKKNQGMARALRVCDAVVYQSQFAKRMADTFLGKPSVPFALIHNGSELSKVTRIVDKPLFLAVSKWRPHKRLADTIESFLLAGIPDSVLTVAGDVSKAGVSETDMQTYRKNPALKFVGHISQSELAGYFSQAVASIHLCWFDACPNSVVEALCAGVPVVTNNTGGTHELVEMTGNPKLVCQIDSPYDFKPVALYCPPKIDRNKVAEAMWYCLKEKPCVLHEKVSIAESARKYQTFLESLL